MKPFKLISDFQPTGDQPEAIRQLSQGIVSGQKYQTLLGVTGSGKTFTVANVIAQVQRPTLILAHNKTLAAQLFQEFKHFFPENAVAIFCVILRLLPTRSLFALPQGTYIEKELLSMKK